MSRDTNAPRMKSPGRSFTSLIVSVSRTCSSHTLTVETMSEEEAVISNHYTPYPVCKKCGHKVAAKGQNTLNMFACSIYNLRHVISEMQRESRNPVMKMELTV